MSLSEISIKRPVFAWMLMTGLIVFGAVSFFKMGISQFPDVDFPVVNVNIRLEGAAPSVIETEIVDYVENAVMGIEGVRSVTSRSENSEGTITIEFELGRNVDLAVQMVQAKLSQVQSKMPREITAITVSKTNPEDQPIILMTLESDKYPLRDLMYYTSDHLKDQFAMVSGVGDIQLSGYVDPNLRIWVTPQKLKENELSAVDIIDTIQTEHSEQPAGKLESENNTKMEYVRTTGEATSVDEFKNILINQRGGQTNFRKIRLGDVARIEDGMADILGYARAQGVPGVGIGILKQRGTNAVDVAKAVKLKIAEIQKTLPEGMHLNVNFDSTKYIEQAVSELNFTLILAALLTAFVCWLFLGSWSSTVNVLFSIPTSIVGTFTILYFMGFTLNIFTLLGLSLSIGIVVDDAIMVLENIMRHHEEGSPRVEAALIGSKEITFAAIAATISIVAIFLPIVFMKGIIGKFFFQFGVTITAAVLLSLVEALTLTPMRCSQFMEVNVKKIKFGALRERFLDYLGHVYGKSLAKALDNRWKVIFMSLVVLVVSLSTVMFINKEFLPSEDQSRFNIRLKTPLGSSLSYSDSVFKNAETFLGSRKEVDRYVLRLGGGSPGDANNGSILVTLKEPGSRGIDPVVGHELTQSEFMDVCRKELKKIKDLKSSMQDLSTKGFSASRGYPVEFTVQGPEWSALATYAQQMVSELEKSGLVTDMDLDYAADMPELQVVPDRIKAANHGVSTFAIGQTVNAMIGGTLVGRYPKGGHRYDIRLKIDDVSSDPIQKVNSLTVRNHQGELVSLKDLISMKRVKSMLEINRRDRERAISVYANVKAGQSQQFTLQRVQEIAKKILPPQYHIVLGGSSQTFDESFNSLILALILGLFVAYMVLASQFNSFAHPVTVLVALPFSVSGAFVALWITHQSLNIYSMIGLVLLMGIVKKNSILLVDFTNQVRERTKKNVYDSLVEACPIRLRPILMTSIATIAGAIPAALAIGPGAESRVSMSTAVIGGVIVSTLLTLYIVPCVYSLLSRDEQLVEKT